MFGVCTKRHAGKGWINVASRRMAKDAVIGPYGIHGAIQSFSNKKFSKNKNKNQKNHVHSITLRHALLMTIFESNQILRTTKSGQFDVRQARIKFETPVSVAKLKELEFITIDIEAMIGGYTLSCDGTKNWIHTD